MNPAPGIDPVSPLSFTAEQIVDMGSSKSSDDFFCCLALDSLLFLALDGVASLNFVVVRNQIARVLADLLCFGLFVAVQQVHKGIWDVRGFPCFTMHFGAL